MNKSTFLIALATASIICCIFQTHAYGTPPICGDAGINCVAPSDSYHLESFRIGDKTIELKVGGSSRISDFALDEGSKRISFTAIVNTGREGWITIPITEVLEGPYNVAIDGIQVDDLDLQNNSSGDILMTLRYGDNVHEVVISGTKVIPEFPLAVVVASAGAMIAISFGFAKRFNVRDRAQD